MVPFTEDIDSKDIRNHSIGFLKIWANRKNEVVKFYWLNFVLVSEYSIIIGPKFTIFILIIVKLVHFEFDEYDTKIFLYYNLNDLFILEII